VIEEVIKGNYDAGATSHRGFELNKQRGLERIPGSEFERSFNPWVARVNLPEDVARDLTAVLTAMESEDFLLTVPGRPSGFTVITEQSHAPERAAMKRIRGAFPVPPSTNQTRIEK
jgi:hypothetical protein